MIKTGEKKQANASSRNKDEAESSTSQNEDVDYDALSLATSLSKTRLEKNMEGSSCAILLSREQSMIKVDSALAPNREIIDPKVTESLKSEKNGSKSCPWRGEKGILEKPEPIPKSENRVGGDASETSGERICNGTKPKEFALPEGEFEQLSPTKICQAAGHENVRSSKESPKDKAKENIPDSTPQLTTFRKRPVIERVLSLNRVNLKKTELIPMTLHRKLREYSISGSEFSYSSHGISDASEEDRKPGLNCEQSLGRETTMTEDSESYKKNPMSDKGVSTVRGRRRESVSNWLTCNWRSMKPLHENSNLEDSLSFIEARKTQMEEDAVTERGRIKVTFTVGKDDIDESCSKGKICNDFATTCCSQDSTVDFLTDTNSAICDSTTMSALNVQRLENAESLLNMPCDGNGKPGNHGVVNENSQDQLVKKQDSLLSFFPPCILVDSLAPSWARQKTRNDDNLDSHELSEYQSSSYMANDSSSANNREVQHSFPLNGNISNTTSTGLDEEPSPVSGCFHYDRESGRSATNTKHCKDALESKQIYEKRSLPPLSPIRQVTIPQVSYPTDQSFIPPLELQKTSSSLWSYHCLPRSSEDFSSCKRNFHTTPLSERQKSQCLSGGFSTTLRRAFSKTFHFNRVPKTPQVKVCKVRPFTQPAPPGICVTATRKDEASADCGGCQNREYSLESSIGSGKQATNISDDTENISRETSAKIQSETSCISFASPCAPPVTPCSPLSCESLGEVCPIIKDLSVQGLSPLKNYSLGVSAAERCKKIPEDEEESAENHKHEPPMEYQKDLSHDSGYTVGIVSENDQRTLKTSTTDSRSHTEFRRDVAIQMENKEIPEQTLVKTDNEAFHGDILRASRLNREDLVIDGQSTHSSDIDRSIVSASECSIPSYSNDTKCVHLWEYDNSYPWYMWSGKGICLKVKIALYTRYSSMFNLSRD